MTERRRGRTPTRTPAASASLADTLVADAARVVREKGHEALSLRALAAARGVTHVAALHHFASRDALLAAVATRGFDALAAELAAAVRSARTREFRRLGEAYVRWACAHGHLYRLMFASHLRASRAHAELEARAEQLFLFVTDVVARGQAAGDLRSGPAHEVSFFAWCTAHGAAMLLLDTHPSFERLGGYDREALVRAALDGVKRASEPTPVPARRA